MFIRVIIISTLIMLNFVNSPGWWETIGLVVLALIIMFLTMLPIVGWVVVIGCGYLAFNYLYNIHDWNLIISIILGLIVSLIMGALLSSGGQDNRKYQF